MSNYFAARGEDRQWDRSVEEQRRAEFLEAYDRLVETVATLVETGEARQVDSLQALARVEFLAPAHVRNQAKALHKAAVNMRHESYGSNINDEKKRDEAGSAFLEERDRFITAVRREVGPLNEGKQLSIRGSGVRGEYLSALVTPAQNTGVEPRPRGPNRPPKPYHYSP